MLAIVCPGQGAQKPGMLTPWLEVPGLAELLGRFSERAGLDLRRLGTEADAEEIKDTAVTQPLIVAASLLGAARLAVPPGGVVAGHSVGELAAAAVAGVLAPADAVALAGVRGRAMGAACAEAPSSMAAVMGGDPDAVTEVLTGMALTPANVNGAGQIVAAGATAAIEALVAEPPVGTRVIALPVAGAFHTAFMEPARPALGEALAALTPRDPDRPLLTNADGSVVDGGRAFLDLLGAQVTRPVRWDRCMATLAALGVTGVLELPPAGTLVGLVKRELGGKTAERPVETFALKTPDDLDTAAEFVARHAEPRQSDTDHETAEVPA
ncbi:ACP S-malonyltransferase [Nakamurella leprariae]|uniref:[acyl-carrier-protein] S-malonyltransferase n=1 Tax=Nakamurella leprariae TaxID=2803911 RepID=A0A938Y9V9_9ACTN|nr:ACP S-malonyltransferase [Nakamurella leprariae]MBM9465733.1 ACP S-malonyltransferase [Nakamurella leprariae]